MRGLTAPHLLAVVTVVLGGVMIVRAVDHGGGPASFGVLAGILFILAGGLRLWLLRLRG